MTFHRSPAVMAADASFARSPIGESRSRHLLWLTDEDLAAVGEEPDRTRRSIDFDNPDKVAAERASAALWSAWWSRVCSRVSTRRQEAMSDDAWVAEYLPLIAERRAAGPAELAALRAEWDAYDLAHPERGLTDRETALRTANWARRDELCKEYRRVQKASSDSPRLIEILDEMRECERINKSYYELEHSRPSLLQAT
jgi:hypothetical protein